MIRLMGLLLIALPFVAIVAWARYTGLPWVEITGSFAITAVFVGMILLGVTLLDRGH